jgi:hypothetical protein
VKAIPKSLDIPRLFDFGLAESQIVATNTHDGLPAIEPLGPEPVEGPPHLDPDPVFPQ